VKQSKILAPVTTNQGSVAFSYSIRSKSGGLTLSRARIAFHAADLKGGGTVPVPLGEVEVTFDPESGVVSQVKAGSAFITLGPLKYTASEGTYAPPS
jgi:hypothetical protein